jgi:hypothetical protein
MRGTRLRLKFRSSKFMGGGAGWVFPSFLPGYRPRPPICRYPTVSYE